jgi:hypothetical protein
MHSLRKISLLFLLLPAVMFVRAQQFGGNPPSLKWKQINTDTVRVIFPDGLEKIAREIAAMSHEAGRTQSTLGDRIRKVSIVLQNQTTISNGYVGLGPFRSEFYLTPLQNSFELGSLPWHQQLALHEYRHIQQFNNFRKGVSALFYVLAGELGQSFANNTALPNWFWEGDAVYQETITSKQGRGRLPFFFNGYRSLWAANKNYSWLKLRNGSLRDYVPDHYQMGYLLTAYGREKYGDSIWRAITNHAVRFRTIFYPFQAAIKKYTGEEYRSYRKQAFDFYKKNLIVSQDSAARFAAKQLHFAGDEEFPQWVDENNIVLVSSSYSKIPRFVVKNITTGEERKIRVKDISIDNYFSYKNGLIVYSAYDADLRWGWRDYSEIRLLDVNTGGQKTVARKTKYFSPDISRDSRKIVAVQVLPGGKSNLHIINSQSGELEKELPNNQGYFYTYPKFFGKNSVVSPIRNIKGEMGLGMVEIETGAIEWLVPFSMNVIGFPQVNGDTICFTASFGERDELFAIVSKKLYKINPVSGNTSTGAYQPALRNGRIVFVNFTAAGFRYYAEELKPGSFEELSPGIFLKALTNFGIASVNSKLPIPVADTLIGQPVRHYSKAHRILNFHSWLPSISDPEYSISFISENVLNTLQSDVYFTYNNNEQSKKMGFVGAYGALYPWLRMGAAYIKDRRFTFRGNPVLWDESEFRTGLLLPLNLMQGRFYNSLRIGTDYVYVNPEYKGLYKDTFDGRGYGYINSYLTFTSQIQKARQHIYPRFAQTIRVDYNKAVTGVDGNQFLANGLFYFPGLHVNHNLVINLAVHLRDSFPGIVFTNNFPFSRGYSERNFHRMYKLGANYHLPLFYPDWGFASIVYFLRVRANAFFDFTRIGDYNSSRVFLTRELKSFGSEIFFDTKWWNQHPVSFGFRYSRLLDGELQGLGPNQFEFVLPVNLINR